MNKIIKWKNGYLVVPGENGAMDETVFSWFVRRVVINIVKAWRVSWYK